MGIASNEHRQERFYERRKICCGKMEYDKKPDGKVSKSARRSSTGFQNLECCGKFSLPLLLSIRHESYWDRNRIEIRCYAASYVILLADNLLEKLVESHGPEELRMAHMLTIAHEARSTRCACQAARNQARLWWGTIDKFEAATFYWRVSILLHKLHYLFEPQL